MKTKTKRWLVCLAFVLVAGFAALNVLAYNHAHAMMHFTEAGTRTDKPENLSFWKKVGVLLAGVNIPRPTSNRPPSDLAPGCRALTIAGLDSVTLSAWYCDRGKTTPLVILFHGYSKEKTSLLKEAKAILGRGASVLLADFRGSGGSSKSYTTIGFHEAEDVATVVRHARDHFSHSSVILFGQSMGSVAVLRAIHANGISPDAVILEGVFDTMLNTIRNRFGSMGIPSFPGAWLLVFWGGKQGGFDAFAHNPVDYARSMKCPAMFMHGMNDPRAKLAEARAVFAAAAGPKVFKKFESVGHGPIISKCPEEWLAAVGEIIRKASQHRVWK